MEVVAQSSNGGGTDWKAAEGVYVSPQDSDFKQHVRKHGVFKTRKFLVVDFSKILILKLKSLTRDPLMMSYNLDLDF